MGSIIVPLLHQVLALVKGMVYPTMNILPLFIHLYVVSNSMLWKWERILKKNLYAPLNNQIHLYWPYRHYTLYTMFFKIWGTYLNLWALHLVNRHTRNNVSCYLTSN